MEQATIHSDDSNEVVVRIQHVSKSFNGRQVLRDVCLNVRRGENLVILGRSGEGKSVTLKCVAGLVQQDAGKVEVLGREVSTMNDEELRAMRLHVGYLFQHGALYDSMTVAENLEFPLTRVMKLRNRVEIKDRIHAALASVGLEQAGSKMPSELSGGQRKRIALARTLILDPGIMLYDEPTTGLDTITSKEISQLIRQLQQEKKTSSIIITHDMPCARTTADRLAILSQGEFIAEGTYEELERSGDERISSFFK